MCPAYNDVFRRITLIKFHHRLQKRVQLSASAERPQYYRQRNLCKAIFLQQCNFCHVFASIHRRKAQYKFAHITHLHKTHRIQFTHVLQTYTLFEMTGRKIMGLVPQQFVFSLRCMYVSCLGLFHTRKEANPRSSITTQGP